MVMRSGKLQKGALAEFEGANTLVLGGKAFC